MLDALGERYGMLPSEILERGNTFDLWVYDAAVSYINQRQQKNDPSSAPRVQNYSVDELQKRMERVRVNNS